MPTKSIFAELIADESGVALTEHALLLAFITLMVFTAISSFRDEVVGFFERTGSTLSSTID